MEFLEAIENTSITLCLRCDDKHRNPRQLAANAGGRLDVLRHLPWQAGEDHNIETIDVHAVTNDVGCHDAADALTDRSVLCTRFDFLHRLDHARHVYAAVECLYTKIATSNLLDISPHSRFDGLSHLVAAPPCKGVGMDDVAQKR